MEASYLIIRILQEFPDIRLPPGHPVVPTGQEKQELTVFLKSAEGCKVVVRSSKGCEDEGFEAE